MLNVFQLKNFILLSLALTTFGLLIAVSVLWMRQLKLEQSISNPTPTTATNAPSTELAAIMLNEAESNSSLQASMSAVNSRLSQIESQLIHLSKEVATQSGSKSNTPATSLASSFSKETLYLGSATTKSQEWSETGLEIGINSAHYPAGVTVKLEASLSTIGGEAWVRITNKSTGAVISLSEISHNTSTATWKLSPSFALHPGGYTYSLEARSTSGETANISGARLIIEK